MENKNIAKYSKIMGQVIIIMYFIESKTISVVENTVI